MIRLDKFLADMGLGTRSQVKEFIKKGQISVDGSICKSGDSKIDPENCHVTYLGTTLSYEKNRYYLLNKPQGYVCANTDNVHKTVFELFKGENLKGLFTVGRLDVDTEGLLLITDDGAFSHDLMSPSKHISKTYFAKVSGIMKAEHVEMFNQGLDIGDPDLTKPAQLKIISTDSDLSISEIELTITEGRYHQVKRMCQAVGCEVTYLKRISIGSLTLPSDLPLGTFKKLSSSTLNQIRTGK